MPDFLEHFTEDLVAAYGMRAGPSLRLEELAKRLGAAEVRYATLGSRDGVTAVEGRKIVIYIHSSRPTPRQRFTLAHEIGHLVLAQPGLQVASARRRAGLAEDERFCNAFAASLLLPSGWLIEQGARHLDGLQALRQLAWQSRTSLTTCVLRLQDLFGWRQGIVRWRNSHDYWTMTSRIGVPWMLRERLVTTRRTQHYLDHLASAHPSQSVRVALALGSVGLLVEVPSDVVVKRDTIVALADFGPALRHERQRRAGFVQDPLALTGPEAGTAPK